MSRRSPPHPVTPIAWRHAGLLAAMAGGLVSGCRGPQSTLDPAGPAADSIASIWWLMLAGAGVMFVLVLGLLAFALMRRGRGPALRHPTRLIVAGGLVLPTGVLAALLVYGVAASGRITGIGEPVDRSIQVIGHRWFWTFRYLDEAGRVIASSIDRLAIPRDALVEFQVTSADVIHSFWIPRLGGKIDAIPGRVNVLRLRADAGSEGAIRGQCAEFCGRDHAHMTFDVEVLDDATFAAWLMTNASGDNGASRMDPSVPPATGAGE